MEMLLVVLRYTFLLALGIEGLVIVAALVRLAREKARAVPPVLPTSEE